MAVIIEQLGTTNNVLERQRFDGPRVSLGRGFDNDVILTDEHVDAHHARVQVDEDGGLWLEDLDSVNGIRRPRHKQRLERTRIRSGDVFLVGRSRVRVYGSDHPVAPAVRIRLTEVFLLWLGKPQVALLLAALFVVAKVLETWFSTIGEFRWSLVAEQHVGEVLTFAALAVGVYFLSVLFRRGGNFLAHLSLLIVLFLFASLAGFGQSVAEFNAGDGSYRLLTGLAEGRGYLLLFLYFWSILYLAFHIPLVRRTWISALVVLVWFGIDNLPDDGLQRFIDSQQFPLRQTFLPPPLLLVEPESAETFEGRMQDLFPQLDEQREDALSERDANEAGADEKGAAAVEQDEDAIGTSAADDAGDRDPTASGGASD